MSGPTPPQDVRRWRPDGSVRLVRSEPTETVCPNFHVLAHAVGCGFQPQCSYCYLRDLSQYPPTPGDQADRARMFEQVRAWIARDELDNYVLNAGNLSDSLAMESSNPIMGELVELFRVEAEARGRPHTLLLVTKGGLSHCATLRGVKPSRNVILSFSVNCPEAAARHEPGAAPPSDRLAAAGAMKALGWRVRIRIDPMIAGCDYTQTVRQVRLLAPERLTLGCLRADGRLGEFVAPGTLAGLVDPGRPDGLWQYPRDTRLALYRPAVEALRGICSIGLCEEWPDVWDELGLDRAARTCNCNHL